MRALIPLAAAFLLVLAGCSDDDAGGEPSVVAEGTRAETATTGASCEPGFSPVAGDVPTTITSRGVERRYILHVPVSYNGTQRTPLVLVYHGLGGDAASFGAHTRFGAMADEAGFAVAFLEGQDLPPSGWNNDAGASFADDVVFTRDVIADVRASLCVDESRVFAAGFSNGGGMAQRLACALPDVIAAVGTVAATYLDCQAPVPWIAFHGIDDEAVPFEGVEDPPEAGGVAFPARRVISEWARGLGCDGLGTISRPSSEVELTTYVRCLRGDGEALLYAIIGGGHTWPGSDPLPAEDVGHTTSQIDATRAMWDFFAAHPRAP